MSIMSMNKIMTSAAVIAGVVATNLVLLGAAQAEGNNRSRGPVGPSGGYHAPAPAFRHAPPPVYQSYGHGGEHRRHHGGGDLGKGIAIGVGALILGGILASEANRHRDYE